MKPAMSTTGDGQTASRRRAASRAESHPNEQRADRPIAIGKKDNLKTKTGKSQAKKPIRKPKAERLSCRYCGSYDLAPSFIKRRDRRCRKCFSKRYRSAARAKKLPASK